MSSSTLAPPLPSTLPRAKRRARRRAASGGGTMFVVAMTVAVLGTIGAWALQSAALEVRMAGFERQSMQTHYLAEYGVVAVIPDLTSSTLPSILPSALCGTPTANGVVHATCVSVPCVSFTSPVTPLGGTCAEIGSTVLPVAKSCYRWEGSSSFGSGYSTPTTASFLDVGDAGVTGPAGSLGATNMSGNFSVELTEVTQASPASGFGTPGTPGSPVPYWGTITSYGQTSATGASSQGQEQLRSRLKMGPISAVNLGSCQ